MLMLLFHVDDERFACDCEQIMEVIPRVSLRSLSHTSAGIAGVLNYAGKPVPVLDFTKLCVGRESTDHLSTRIILFSRDAGEGKERQTLGMMAERVTNTIERKPSDFSDSGVKYRDASYLGGVFHDESGIIHQVLVDELFIVVSQELSRK